MNYRELRELRSLKYGLACVVSTPDLSADVSICHLCLSPGINTREHVPPRAAFNRDERMWDRLHSNQYEARIVPMPIRAGHHVRALCSHCNSVVCNPYAEEYSQFVKSLIEKPPILDQDGFYCMTVQQDKLRLAKQIATMILAIESLKFARQEAALRRFVLHPTATLVPSFRVLAFLVVKDDAAGTIVRWHSRTDLVSQDYDFAGGEISSYPFGFLYTRKVGRNYKPDKLTDITGWFSGDNNEPERFGVHWTGVGGISDAVGHKRRRPQLDWVITN